MNSKELISLHMFCIDNVLSSDYYVDLFFTVIDHSKFADLDELRTITDVSRIVSFWNDFWYALPDTPAIHRHPFNTICDICEFDYREDDE